MPSCLCAVPNTGCVPKQAPPLPPFDAAPPHASQALWGPPSPAPPPIAQGSPPPPQYAVAPPPGAARCSPAHVATVVGAVKGYSAPVSAANMRSEGNPRTALYSKPQRQCCAGRVAAEHTRVRARQARRCGRPPRRHRSSSSRSRLRRRFLTSRAAWALGRAAADTPAGRVREAGAARRVHRLLTCRVAGSCRGRAPDALPCRAWSGGAQEPGDLRELRHWRRRWCSASPHSGHPQTRRRPNSAARARGRRSPTAAAGHGPAGARARAHRGHHAQRAARAAAAAGGGAARVRRRPAGVGGRGGARPDAPRRRAVHSAFPVAVYSVTPSMTTGGPPSPGSLAGRAQHGTDARRCCCTRAAAAAGEWRRHRAARGAPPGAAARRGRRRARRARRLHQAALQWCGPWLSGWWQGDCRGVPRLRSAQSAGRRRCDPAGPGRWDVSRPCARQRP